MSSTSRVILGWSVVLGAVAGVLHVQAASRVFPPFSLSAERSPTQTLPAAQVATGSPRALLDRYCVTCHNQRLKTAGLMLDRLDVDTIHGAEAEWEKVLAKVRTGDMPPPGRPRPEAAAARGLVTWLEAALDRTAIAHPNPGRVAIHRLNRSEYANAIRDLLGLEIDARALLPSDDADQQGFENIAGVLSVSPALLERYLTVAKRVSRLAVGDLTVAPGFENYNLSKTLVQDLRMSEDLPFGTRGGAAVRHLFPVDADYIVRIRLKRQLYDYIIGLGRPHQLDVRVDGQRVNLLTVGGAAPGTPTPATFAGNIMSDPAWEKYMHDADADLEVRVHAKAGTRTIGVSFVEAFTEPEGVLLPPQTGFDKAVNELYDGEPAIATIAIGGPYQARSLGDSLSRSRIFVCRPSAPAEEDTCATRILTTLARRAYRRPPTPGDVETLLTFYRSGHRDGGFDNGIRSALERILAGPDFLFRIERNPNTGEPAPVSRRLTDLELASRLSFFLWSSIPDDALLAVAERGQLAEPQVLEQQVRRLLHDGRSRALVDNFGSQWMELGKLRGVTPDPDVYPEFDDSLRDALKTEAELFLESQIRGDRSVLELLTADYTFVNERLAAHYGIPNVYGGRFRRVSLDGQPRGGLLGLGGILAVTSYPNRTSPVLRGKWILDNILGTPPPPPPADVPGLKEAGEDGTPRTARELMEQHRKDPQCAGCHMRMDPLGFSLEHFDAIGRWRTTSNDAPVDASASLPDGTTFEGYSGLRQVLAGHQDEFRSTITRKLLTYAVGREMEYYDMPTVRRIAREITRDDSRWSSLILAIVKSSPFQMRRPES